MAKQLSKSNRSLEFNQAIISLAVVEYTVIKTSIPVRYYHIFQCQISDPTVHVCSFSFLFQLEGRKISSSQFLKVLSTLRVWEICSPDVNAAIEVGKCVH